MKLSNKGLTLMELLISIVLLSVVMLAAERIINQLVFIKNNGTIAIDNIITRSTIIDTIQNDLVANGLATTTESRVLEIDKDEDSFTFILTSYKGESSIRVRVNDITYTDFTGKESLWELKNCHTYLDFEDTPGGYFQTLEDDYILLKIRIPIYTGSQYNNEYNNNINDDIIITYYGKYIEL